MRSVKRQNGPRLGKAFRETVLLGNLVFMDLIKRAIVDQIYAVSTSH